MTERKTPSYLLTYLTPPCVQSILYDYCLDLRETTSRRGGGGGGGGNRRASNLPAGYIFYYFHDNDIAITAEAF